MSAYSKQIGLVGDDLLHADRPLLVPGPRQAERLVPGRQLHGARARALRQRHRQHLEQDAIDVVLRLLLGEAQRVDLHAVAEQAVLGIGDAVALGGDLVPQLLERAHLADLGDEAHAGVDEERDAADHRAEVFRRHLARRLHAVEHGLRGGEREGQFLHRRRAGFLQVIRAHVGRVPLRHGRGGEDDGVLDQPQRRLGRKHVGAARQVFLDDVVLDGAGERGSRRALLVGDGNVERQQPRRRRVDGHRGVHVAERDAGEQRAHVADVRHRNADLADLAARQLVVGIVAGLRRQIEGDGEARLPLGEILSIQLVGLRRRRMARVGADQPGLVALGLCCSGGNALRPAHGNGSSIKPVRLQPSLTWVQCKMELRRISDAVSAWRGSASAAVAGDGGRASRAAPPAG